MNDKHIRKIEELSMNAWPSYKIELYDKWLIRFSHQYTYRTNCVEQIGPSEIPIPEKISYCEQIYSDYGNRPCSFKISPVIPQSFDDMLKEKGYEKKRMSPMLMTMSLNNYTPSCDTGVQVTINDKITDKWIMQLFNLNGTTNPTHLSIVPSMLRLYRRKQLLQVL